MFSFYAQFAGVLLIAVMVLVIALCSLAGYLLASRWVERRNNAGHVLGGIFGMLVIVALVGFAESLAWGLCGTLLALFYLWFAITLQRGS